MNRREWIKFFLMVVVAVFTGAATKILAAGVYATVGKLGYKLKVRVKPCRNCKHYKALKQDGECVLPSMRNAMKSKEVLVKPDSSCSMWVQGKV